MSVRSLMPISRTLRLAHPRVRLWDTLGIGLGRCVWIGKFLVDYAIVVGISIAVEIRRRMTHYHSLSSGHKG